MDRETKLWLWAFLLLGFILVIWLEEITMLLRKGKLTIIYQEEPKAIETTYTVKEVTPDGVHKETRES